MTHLERETDQKHALLVRRTDELMGCSENSPEEAELAALAEQSKPTKRSVGKVPGGKV
jgi:hypothetical protein